MADIGIDLGTTNSAVAHLRNTPQIIENQGRQATPSVVAFDEGEILVGQAAKDMAMVLPSVLSVKRHMGTDEKFDLDGTAYTPEQISSIILKDLVKAAEERLGEPVDSAVITIPAYFSGAQKEATKKAGELAGIKSIRLLAEPIAAALAHGAEDVVLVYDLGGGTFDVAVIDCFDYKMLALDGNNYLGGDDFDARLVAHLAKHVEKEYGVDISALPTARQLARNVCEGAKIALSERQHTRMLYRCMIDDKSVDVNLKVTREEFEEMISDLMDSTFEKVQSAIDKAAERQEGFTKDDIQEVLLVGGSTYIPLVQQRLADFFGKQPSKKVNPDLAVALGAGIHTGSGPQEEGVHRLRLAPAPLVTRETSVELSGRTTSGSDLLATGGTAPVSGKADEAGKFRLAVELTPDTINDIAVTATSPDGEKRSGGCQIRHDANFDGKEEVARAAPRKPGGGVTPRALGIDVTGEDNKLGIVIPEQTDIPCSISTRDYCITSSVANTPGAVEMKVNEGNLPYAPLNTLLATLTLETSASPSTVEPVDITFQMTDDHLLTVSARMVNFPDRMVTATINCQSPSGDQLHVIERTERLLNVFGDKLRPEEKTKLNKARQGLLDLSEQYWRQATPERFERVKESGLKLRKELDRLEGAYA